MTASALTRAKPGLWQPNPQAKQFKLSAGGARYANFAHTFIRQTKGRWGAGGGEPLNLEWYQLQWISEGLKTSPSQWLTVKKDTAWEQIEKWVDHDPKFGTIGGPRVYKEWYIQLPKKQGKSTVSSSLGLYFLGYDDEPGAEVYAVAAKKDQARTVFDQAAAMVMKSPILSDQLKVYRSVIEHRKSGSIFRVISADGDYNEGFNPHAVIIDELHAHKNRDIYDAMTSHLHTGARDDPIVVVITNAGTDEDSVCYEVYTQARAVIDGLPDARTDLYAFVPELTEKEIYDPKAWPKVMPASWSSVPLMEEAAKKLPTYVFQRRYLNVWTDAQDDWLQYEFWDYGAEKDLAIPKGIPIVVAGDMGMTKDTTSMGWAGVDNTCSCGAFGKGILSGSYDSQIIHDEDCQFGDVMVGAHIWGIRQKDNARWPPCHERLVDERFPIKLLRQYMEDELRPNYEILEFVYDPWMMEQLAQELGDEGLNCVPFAQTDARMIPASEDLHGLIVNDRKLFHPADPVLTRHVMSGVVVETGRGWRIDKRKTKKPIDGLITMLMSVHRALYYFRSGAPSFTAL